MTAFNEFSESFYVKEFLKNYAGLIANLTDSLEKETKQSLDKLIDIEKKAKNILTTVNYLKYKKKKNQLTKNFNQKLLEQVDKHLIETPINVALKSLKKHNIYS